MTTATSQEATPTHRLVFRWLGSGRIAFTFPSDDAGRVRLAYQTPETIETYRRCIGRALPVDEGQVETLEA